MQTIANTNNNGAGKIETLERIAVVKRSRSESDDRVNVSSHWLWQTALKKHVLHYISLVVRHFDPKLLKYTQYCGHFPHLCYNTKGLVY